MALPVPQRSEGEAGHLSDHNALAAAVDEALTGRPFASVLTYATQTESLILDPEATTNWVATNCTLTTDSTNKTLSTKSVQANAVAFCWDNAPNADTKAYVNLASDATRGDRTDLAFDFRWQAASGSWAARPGDFFEFVASDAVDLGGTIVTAAIPLNNDTNAFATMYLAVHALTKVRSFGFRFIPTKAPAMDHTARAFRFNFDNIRWAAQTEMERALGDVEAVVVPPDYMPGSSQKVLALPSDRSVVDLRSTGFVATGDGVKSLRQFQVLAEDGSSDVRQRFTDAAALLRSGDRLVLPPNAQYRFTGTSGFAYLKNLDNVEIDFQNAVVYTTEQRTQAFFNVANCRNLRIRNARVIGANPQTYLGSTLTTVVGTPTVVSTGVELNALAEEVRTNQLWFSRDKDGKVDVDVTLSDTAQVASDCVIEFVDALAPSTTEQALFAAAASGTTGPVASGTRLYGVTYVDEDGFETGMGPTISVTLSTPGAVSLTDLPVASARGAPVVQRNIYRTLPGAADNPGAFTRVAEIYDNTTTTWLDRTTDTAELAPTLQVGATVTGSGNVEAGTHQWFYSNFNSTTGLESALILVSKSRSLTLVSNSSVDLSNIAAGPSGTTARRIYRTKADVAGQGLKYLVGTISDNTTTTFTDNVSDASLTDVGPQNGPQGQLPPLLPKRVLTLTGTPTSYRISLPGPLVFARQVSVNISKATATTNTITVAQVFTDRGRGAGSGSVEPAHGWVLSNNNGDVVFDNCTVEGTGGDGWTIQGDGDAARITLRDSVVHCVGRQGITVSAKDAVLIEGSTIAAPGHWGIDVEPETYGAYTESVTIRDCDFYQGGLARGAISAAIGLERAGLIVIERVRCFGRRGDIDVSALIVRMADIDAPWARVAATARQSVIGRVRCSAFELPRETKGAFTTFLTNNAIDGSVVYGPILITDGQSRYPTVLNIEDPTIPIGPIVYYGRTQPQVQMVPVVLTSGVPTDADFPYTPLDGAEAINTSTDTKYYRKGGIWTVLN